jgi:hypothetical protein
MCQVQEQSHFFKNQKMSYLLSYHNYLLTFSFETHCILNTKIKFPIEKHSSKFLKDLKGILKGQKGQTNACGQWIGHPCYMGTKSFTCNAYLGHNPQASK